MFDHLRCVEGTVGRELSTQVLEDEICTEAAHMAVSECHFVLLAAELDRRGEWAGQGLRSMAHWLNWRCGTSLMAAREQVRVGRALNKLPVLRTAFASGELSYSKARAITRAATPETEEALVEVARYTTASQLEAIMREYRKASPDERKEALQRHQDLRYVRSWTDDDGMTVIQARLSPEDAAVVLAAIEAAREASWQASRRKDSAADVPAGTSATVDAGTTANPEPNVPAGTSWDPETSWDEETASEGSSSSLAFEAQIEEFEQSRADALVNVCEAVLANGLPTEGTTGPPITVLLHIDEEVLKDPTSEGCSFLDGGGAISSHTARRLACSSAVHTLVYRIDGTVDPTGSTRSVPRRLRRAVLARDRGCRFPGCTQRRFVDVHHVVFWSEGGPTVASNLTTLCRAHHRLVHEGGFHLEMDAGCHVRVWAPNGVEVMACPPLSALSLPRPEEQHRSAGLDLGPATLAYGGESCDLSYVTDVLLEAAYGKD